MSVHEGKKEQREASVLPFYGLSKNWWSAENPPNRRPAGQVEKGDWEENPYPNMRSGR